MPLPAHADASAIGAFEHHAAIGSARTVFGAPIDWSPAIPPVTIAPADPLAGVVITNRTNLMVAPTDGLAIARPKGCSGLNPASIGAAVLGSLRCTGRQHECGSAQQQCDPVAHGTHPQNHSLTTPSWIVSFCRWRWLSDGVALRVLSRRFVASKGMP